MNTAPSNASYTSKYRTTYVKAYSMVLSLGDLLQSSLSILYTIQLSSSPFFWQRTQDLDFMKFHDISVRKSS